MGILHFEYAQMFVYEQARKLQATLEGCNSKLWLTDLLAHRGKV